MIFKSTNQSVVWLKRPVVWLVIKLIDTRESVKVLGFFVNYGGWVKGVEFFGQSGEGVKGVGLVCRL